MAHYISCEYYFNLNIFIHDDATSNVSSKAFPTISFDLSLGDLVFLLEVTQLFKLQKISPKQTRPKNHYVWIQNEERRG